jgi:hypothetical protein
LWRKATTYHLLPSQILHEEDALAAWQLDNAITTFGTLVENMLLERDEVQVGDRKEYKARHSITQLLDPEYVYPKSDSDVARSEDGWDMSGIVGVEGLGFDEAPQRGEDGSLESSGATSKGFDEV